MLPLLSDKTGEEAKAYRKKMAVPMENGLPARCDAVKTSGPAA